MSLTEIRSANKILQKITEREMQMRKKINLFEIKKNKTLCNILGYFFLLASYHTADLKVENITAV